MPRDVPVASDPIRCLHNDISVLGTNQRRERKLSLRSGHLRKFDAALHHFGVECFRHKLIHDLMFTRLAALCSRLLASLIDQSERRLGIFSRIALESPPDGAESEVVENP
jgi:hypothetical protein